VQITKSFGRFQAGQVVDVGNRHAMYLTQYKHAEYHEKPAAPFKRGPGRPPKIKEPAK
jgi:hypothetical protein